MMKIFSNRILKTLVLVFVFFMNLNFVEDVFARTCTVTNECPTAEYCSDTSKNCEPRRSENNLCGKAEQCISNNCINGLCRPENYVANNTSVGGVDIEATYSTSNCDDKCPDEYQCRLYSLPSVYKCIAVQTYENTYEKQNCMKMVFGLPFSGMAKGSCVPLDTGIPNLIKYIIQFIFASIGTISVIILILAGFMWSFSAGNVTTIKKAQAMIKNVSIGLIFAIFSGSILAIINPNLVDLGVFKSIRPTDINIQVDESSKYSNTVYGIKNIDNVNCNGSSIPLFIQNRSLYDNVSYLGKNGEKCYYNNNGEKIEITIGNSGCGPTSAAMIFKYYGIATYNDPKKTSSYSSQNDYMVCSTGATKDGFFSAISNVAGLKYKFVDKDSAKEYLQAGMPLIALVGPISGSCKEYFTTSGHYLVVSCYDSAKNAVKIRDPYIWKAGERNSADFSSLVNCLKNGGFYAIYKTAPGGAR